jgi:hypothetical protein
VDPFLSAVGRLKLKREMFRCLEDRRNQKLLLCFFVQVILPALRSKEARYPCKAAPAVQAGVLFSEQERVMNLVVVCCFQVDRHPAALEM